MEEKTNTRSKEINSCIETMRVNIKGLRVKKNISQKSIAKAMNLSQNAYSKIELGRSKLQVEAVILLCEILHVDVAALLNENKYL